MEVKQVRLSKLPGWLAAKIVQAKVADGFAKFQAITENFGVMDFTLAEAKTVAVRATPGTWRLTAIQKGTQAGQPPYELTTDIPLLGVEVLASVTKHMVVISQDVEIIP